MKNYTYILLVVAFICGTGTASAAFETISEITSASTDMSVIERNNSPETDTEEAFQASPNWSSDADAIIEKYGNWTFDCRRYAEKPRCSINQKLESQLGIEILHSNETHSNKALILLPFGLAVSEGIALIVDNKPSDQRIPFSTCAEEGCIISMVLEDKSMEQILAATQLKIISFDAVSLKRKEFFVPLDGIARAFLRLKNFQ
ncbi:invasion associated locus B family protein [Brucellaceae bacterium C25G]